MENAMQNKAACRSRCFQKLQTALVLLLHNGQGISKMRMIQKSKLDYAGYWHAESWQGGIFWGSGSGSSAKQGF
jgi:hypothetical protein